MYVANKTNIAAYWFKILKKIEKFLCQLWKFLKYSKYFDLWGSQLHQISTKCWTTFYCKYNSFKQNLHQHSNPYIQLAFNPKGEIT